MRCSVCKILFLIVEDYDLFLWTDVIWWFIQLAIVYSGHSLEEIRVRALQNILSKLEYGLVSNSDLVHERHLHIRLLEWFNFASCPLQDRVLGLILRLSEVLFFFCMHSCSEIESSVVSKASSLCYWNCFEWRTVAFDVHASRLVFEGGSSGYTLSLNLLFPNTVQWKDFPHWKAFFPATELIIL